ncbi:hypothetical protein [Roseibium album]|uniref:hypothetical protein n=1 Tax=Roseibium album TaxID=311410 RepID=UPI003299E59E
MSQSNVVPWQPVENLVALDGILEPSVIVQKAVNLRPKERKQIISNFQLENYEMASSYVFTKSMALLKMNLASMGMDFIGELLQRPDIDADSDPAQAVSDYEAINIAYELGAINKTQRMRLLVSMETVNHFAGSFDANDDDADMLPEEALTCVKVCVQSVLGLEKVEAAQSFISFREKLSSTTLAAEDPDIVQLLSSPYFFKKTCVSILLNILKSAKGAALENGSRNTVTIVPRVWPDLNGPERWQIGQAYSELFNDGKSAAIKSLHGVLVTTGGFDYVPESLRSNSFTQAAHAVLVAHQGMNNFYNEPKPMKELAAMGSSIPGPAFSSVMTATLAVKLGNRYGVSWGAAQYADQILNNLSEERWIYYLTEQLPQDTLILSKLGNSECAVRWIELLSSSGISAPNTTNRLLGALLAESLKGDAAKSQVVSRNAISILT